MFYNLSMMKKLSQLLLLILLAGCEPESDFEKNKEFYSDKINTAKFYFDKVLPRAEYHYKSAISGSSNIMNFKFN